MHLMLVNDDGIRAPGLRAMCDAAVKAGHKVSICAPDEERSAASHSISLRKKMRAVKQDYPGADIAYAADGMPADCARLGLYLIPDVDIVISGINNGSNMGGACIYSGTVAAATEASMSGTPALAVSLCAYNAEDYSAAAKVALKVVDWMEKHPLPRGAIYNLNVPALPYEQIKGVKAADLAHTYLDSPFYIETPTEDGILYSYKHGVDSVTVDDPDCDVILTQNGYASLTKLTWNLRLNAPEPDASGIRL